MSTLDHVVRSRRALLDQCDQIGSFFTFYQTVENCEGKLLVKYMGKCVGNLFEKNQINHFVNFPVIINSQFKFCFKNPVTLISILFLLRNLPLAYFKRSCHLQGWPGMWGALLFAYNI